MAVSLSASEADALEVHRVAEEIVRGCYSRVALQFPDDLLRVSADTCRALDARIKALLSTTPPPRPPPPALYILADTTFGSCCPDVVAAAHVDADLIVHYGRACLSSSEGTPVLYVFGRDPVDATDAAAKLAAALAASSDGNPATGILLLSDTRFYHAQPAVRAALVAALPPDTVLIESRIDGWSGGIGSAAPAPPPASEGDGGQETAVCGRAFRLPDGAATRDFAVAYIGGESLTLTNVVMSLKGNTVFAYDPQSQTAELASSEANRLLMRRYALVQKARDADVIGILVGTLGV
ncbi:Diphthamide biosynthesis protein 2, partial [Cladochytrium tenue]